MYNKSRWEAFGTFTHFEQEESASALYYVSIERMKTYREQLKRLPVNQTQALVKPVLELSKRFKAPLKIVDFVVSPLDDAIYVNCRSKDDVVYWEETSAYRLKLNVEQALDEHIVRERVKKNGPQPGSNNNSFSHREDLSYLGELTTIPLPKGAAVVGVSPDADRLLIRHKARDNRFFTQSDLWTLELAEAERALSGDELAGHMKIISADIDQAILHHEWVKDGVFVSYPSGTRTKIAHLTESGAVHEVAWDSDTAGITPLFQFHATPDGVLGFIGASESTFPEVFIAIPSPALANCELMALTDLLTHTAHWDMGAIETIRWTSKDGTEIEGVLRKPRNFDPNRKYPLVFVTHGGPVWFSAAYLLDVNDIAYYPSVQFNHRDILVLKPNYRGSIGRGQAFMELNKDNLGVGDLADLESAIAYLDAEGFVDTSRVGCMGWSHGGYISAFAGTHSDKFRAVSVGAGVSDWYTCHIANDDPHFTIHYLSGSPFRDRERYSKTAPISNIHAAKTPALIQHGAQDRRVPLANATELYRGLQEMGVHVELFVFPEMAHPITKPRENRAVMWQNFTWFCHHLLGDKLDFFESHSATALADPKPVEEAEFHSTHRTQMLNIK